MMVQTGAADVVVAGGAESMSNVEYYSTAVRKGARFGSIEMHDRLTRARLMSQPIERYGVISGMIETAENVARDFGITREQSDAYAVRSHQRAAAAWREGRFDDEVIPISITQKRGDPIVFDHDEGYRADASIESLAALRPLEGGVVTVGNASQQNDGAAACLLVAEDRLAELGLQPSGWFVGWAAAGCDPSRMGIGPVPAVERLFARTGLDWRDVGLIDLNDAWNESHAELRQQDGGFVTVGNASKQNAGAAACLLVAEDRLAELGLQPSGWFVGWAAAGCDPSRMGIGPVPAVERLFARTGLDWRDVGLIELNEAFAPQVLAVLKEWGWSEGDSRLDILNVNGSGISLGHPIGVTGVRIAATMLNEMRRRDVRYGLETMCIGGGQGLAAIFER